MNTSVELTDICKRLAGMKIAKMFDPANSTHEINELKSKIHAGFVNAYISTLGGPVYTSIMLTVVVEPKQDWVHGILQNMTYFQFSIGINGTVENFRSALKPAMRKFQAKNIDEIIAKINQYISKAKPRQASSLSKPQDAGLVDVYEDIQDEMKRAAYNAYIDKGWDWQVDHQNQTQLEVSIRYWGQWENPPGEEEEDYDWQILTRKSVSVLKKVVEALQKKYKDHFKIDISPEEKNVITFRIHKK